MSNNKFQFDISQKVKDINELSRAIQDVGGVTHGVLNRISQLVESLGFKMSSASGAASELTSRAAPWPLSAPFAPKPSNIESYIPVQASPERQQDLIERFMKVIPKGMAASIIYPAPPPPEVSWQRESQVLQPGPVAQQAPAQAPQVSHPPETNRTGASSLATLATAPQMLSRQSEVERLGKTLADMTARLGESNKDLSAVLNTFHTSLERANTQFANAMKQFTAASKMDPRSDEYQRAVQELTDAIRDLDASIEASTEAVKNASAGGPGGPGRFGGDGGDGGEGSEGGARRRFLGSVFGRIDPMLMISGIGQAMSLSTGAIQAVSQVRSGYIGAVVGRETEAAQLRGAALSTMAENALASVDMTKAENILKYRADVLFPYKKFDYIGESGRLNALRVGIEQVELERERQAEARFAGTTGAIGRGISGIAKVIGGIAVAAGGAASALGSAGILIGGGLAASGVSDIIEAGGGGVSSYIQSPITAREGGLSTGMTGILGRTVIGQKYSALAQFAQRAENARDIAQALQIAEEVSHAEIRQNMPAQIALEQALRAKEAGRRGAMMVGARAITGATYRRELAAREETEFPEYYQALRGLPSAQEEAARAARRKEIMESELSIVQRGLTIGRVIPETKKALAGRFGETEADAIMKRAAANVESLSRAIDESEKRRENLQEFAQQRLAELYNVPEAAKRAQEAAEKVKQFQDIISKRESDVVRAQRLPVSPWAEFGMMQSEFVEARNLTESVIRGSTTADTRRLLNLQYGGLGSIEQMAQNLASLNQIAGGTNNLEALERVMAAAVARGFDSARTAQQFVQSVDALSRTLKVSTVSTMAASLGAVSMVAGSTLFRSDEQSLMRAAKGVADFGEFSRQTGGITGALKWQSLLGAGIGIGRGANILSGMTIEQLKSAEEQLRSGKITDPNLQNLMALSGKSNREMLQTIKNMIAGGASQHFRAMAEWVAGGDLDIEKKMQEIRGLKGTKRQTEIRSLLGLAQEVAPMLGLSEEGAIAAMTQEMVRGGVISEREAAREKRILGRKIAEGKAKSIDVAEVNRARYIDSLVSSFSAETRGVTVEQYKRYLKEGGAPLEIEGKRITDRVLGEAIVKGEVGLLEKVGAQLQEMSTMDLARGMFAAEAATAQEQKVRVTNLHELAAWVATFHKANLGGGKIR